MSEDQLVLVDCFLREDKSQRPADFVVEREGLIDVFGRSGGSNLQASIGERCAHGSIISGIILF